MLAEKQKLTFPVLSDPGGTAIKAFGVFDPETEIAWPSIFVVKKDSPSPTIIEHRWLADTFRERIATPEVLAKLRE